MVQRAAQPTPPGAPSPPRCSAATRVASWLLPRDPRRLASLYLVAVLCCAFGGGLLAVLLRLEALTPENDLFAAETYARILGAHGLLMVFVVLVPAIPTTLGALLVPQLLGTRSLAFPTLGPLSFYLYLAGAAFLIYAMTTNPTPIGWTLAGSSGAPLFWALAGLLLLGGSGALHGFNLIATIHAQREAGPGDGPPSCFPEALYLAAGVHLVALPLLLLLVALVGLEHWGHVAIFGPHRGGSPALFAHLFWAYAHPVVYAAILPALGLVSDMLASGKGPSRSALRKPRAVGLAIALLALLGWGQHLLHAGVSELTAALFSALALALAVPVVVVIARGTETLRRDGAILETPSLYGIAALVMLIVGTLSGVLLAALFPGAHLHGTTFAVGHAHALTLGGTFLAFLGGLHRYWFELTGRRCSVFWGRIGAAALAGGILLTCFALLVLGAKGMLRAASAYDQLPVAEQLASVKSWQGAATVGSQILVLGFAVVICCLLGPLFRPATTVPQESAAPPPPAAAPSLRPGLRRPLLALFGAAVLYALVVGYVAWGADLSQRDTRLEEPAATQTSASTPAAPTARGGPAKP